MPTTTKPNTKKRQKAESREKLLDAVEATIRDEGPGAVTTVKVTKKAGFAQSAFYLHFDNVDHCLRCAGERIATSIRTAVVKERRRMQSEALGDFDAELGFYHFVLGIFDDRWVANIILKNRHDASPLGKVIGELIIGLREDLAEDMWNVAQSFDIDEKYRPRFDILSDFLLANSLAAGEALLDRRVTNREMLASQLTMTMKAACEDLFKFCNGGK